MGAPGRGERPGGVVIRPASGSGATRSVRYRRDLSLRLSDPASYPASLGYPAPLGYPARAGYPAPGNPMRPGI